MTGSDVTQMTGSDVTQTTGSDVQSVPTHSERNAELDIKGLQNTHQLN